MRIQVADYDYKFKTLQNHCRARILPYPGLYSVTLAVYKTVANRDQDKPSTHEAELFRREVAGAQPVKTNQRRKPERRLPSARPRSREADDLAVMTELLRDGPEDLKVESGDEISHRQPGVQLSVMRRLRRGHYRCQAELDLHGQVVSAARTAVVMFLKEAQAMDYRCVRIVHGKGLRSGHRGAVIKTKLAHWLRQREDVLAYTSARQVDGGTGAVYVLLRRQTK